MNKRAEKHWVIVKDGAVIAQVVTSGPHPKDEGVDFDDKTMTAYPVDRQGDLATEIWDGKAWVEDAAKIDARLHARIDDEAGAARLRFITDVPGQAATYECKEREARDWLATKKPVSADFPFLAAEANAEGIALTLAAREIIAAADRWVRIAAMIEGARIAAKRAVSAAVTLEKKKTAAAVNWDAILAR